MAIDIKISPQNIIDFGDFESWSKGTSTAPDGWSMTGTAGSVSRETSNIKFGTYAMRIISGASGVYAAEHAFLSPTVYAGRTVKFGAWVKCSTASKARVYVDDGVTARVNSSYHTGGGEWEFLTAELQVDQTPTELTFGCEVAGNAVTAYFDGAIAAEGEVLFTSFQDTGIYVREGDFTPDVSVNITEFDVPRRDGSIVDGVRLASKEISLKVQLWNDDYATARALYDSVVKAISSGNQNSVLGSVKELYFFDDRKLRVHLRGVSKLRYLAGARVFAFTIGFVAPDPRDMSVSKMRTLTAVSSSPDTFSIPYLGSITTRPSFHFVATGADITNMTLENLTTGERFSYLSTISAGNTLFVDCMEGVVENDLVDDKTNHTGDLFLSLCVGTNYFKYTGSLGTILTDYRNQYL